MAGEDMGSGRIGGAQFGIGQMIMGAMNRKKSEAAIPSLNPAERQLLTTVQRRRKALQTGTAATGDRAALRQTLAQFGQNSFRSGGPVNTGILNQLRTQGQKNISDQYGQEFGQTLAQEGKVVKDISDFFNDVQFLKSARLSARGEQQMQAGQQNLLASLPSREELMKVLSKVATGGAA